jgi:hypothetical protein
MFCVRAPQGKNSAVASSFRQSTIATPEVVEYGSSNCAVVAKVKSPSAPIAAASGNLRSGPLTRRSATKGMRISTSSGARRPTVQWCWMASTTDR